MSDIGGVGALKKPSALLLGLGLGGGVIPPPGNDPDYQAILDYATLQGYVLPSLTNQDQQNLLVIQLKSIGVWDLLDVFYNFFTDGSADFAKINWKTPGTYNADGTGHDMPFAVNSGFSSVTGTEYFETGFAPTLANQWKVNDASWAVGLGDNGVGGGIDMGDNVLNQQFFRFAGGGNVQLNIDSASQMAGVFPGSLEFTHFQKRPDNLYRIFRQGVELGTAPSGNSVLSTVSFHINGFNNGAGHNNGNIGRLWQLVMYGASLTGKELALYNAWNTYKASDIASSAYKAIIDYATLQGYALPTLDQQADQEALINDLVLAGVWAKIRVFYNFFTNGDRNFAKINWKAPGTYQGVENGAPIFAPNKGFKGAVVADYIDTWPANINPDAASWGNSSMFFDLNNGASPGLFNEDIYGDASGGFAYYRLFNANTPGQQGGSLYGNTGITILSPNVLGFQMLTRDPSITFYYHDSEIFQTSEAPFWPGSAGFMKCAGDGLVALTSFYQGCFGLGFTMSASLYNSFNTAWKAYKAKWTPAPYDQILEYATSQGFTLPSAPQQTLQRQLVDDLIAAGVWDKLDVFHNFYTDGSPDFAKINWRYPGINQLDGVGHEPIFTVNDGFKGDGVGKYFKTGFIAGSGLYKIKKDSGVLFYDATQPTTPAAGIYEEISGVLDSGKYGLISVVGNEGLDIIYDDPSGGGTPGRAELMNGFYSVDRPAPANIIKYKSGIQTQTGAAVSTALPDTLDSLILAFHNGPSPDRFSKATIRSIGWGSSLASQQHLDLFNALTAYKAAAVYSAVIELANSFAIPLPSAKQQEAGQWLVYNLMLEGIWEKLDVFYNFFTDSNIFFAGINWKNPAASSLGIMGGVAFALNSGITGDGATGYVTTGIIPGTTTTALKLDSAGVFLDITGVTPGSKALFGAVEPGVGSVVFYPSMGGLTIGRLNDDVDITGSAPNPADGFWLVERNSNVEVKAIMNYDVRISSNIPASAFPGFELFMLASNVLGAATDFSDATISCFAVGGSFKQHENRLYQLWTGYKARAV